MCVRPSALQRRRVCAIAVLAIAASTASWTTAVHAQQGRGLLGRPSPPQPQQKQGVDYFAGQWKFSWSGRESPLTPGPRSGVVTFAPANNALTMETKGTIDGGGPYQESGTFTWNDEKKQLSMREQMSGIALVSVGDWTSPIAINVESEPVTVKGQSLKLRRFYSILSATSFSVVEELSVAGGPFVRLGKGDFIKQ